MDADPDLAAELAPHVVLDDRYRLVRRLGQGGFGDVWHAVELLPGGAALRDVALKLLLPQVAIGSWTDEAKIVASFAHPSLVTIFAAGLLGERQPFVAMELLDGQSLQEELREKGTLPWRAALHHARDIAAALDVIHQRGVIHLDLKPANVFVTRDRRVKVLDFGIARRQDGVRAPVVPGGPLVAPGAPVDPFLGTAVAFVEGGPVVGTPGFVAPEVLEQREPTPASDAYALGALIVVLTSGRLPQWVSVEIGPESTEEGFRNWWSELRESTRCGKLASSADALPRGVRDLVRRLLALDPAERVAPEGLFAMVDEVWHAPHGLLAAPFAGRATCGPEREGTLGGRAAECDHLFRTVAHEAVVCVHGPRGSGKRSLLFAGVVPALARARVDGMDDWIALPIDRDTTHADLARVVATDATLATVGVDVDSASDATVADVHAPDATMRSATSASAATGSDPEAPHTLHAAGVAPEVPVLGAPPVDDVEPEPTQRGAGAPGPLDTVIARARATNVGLVFVCADLPVFLANDSQASRLVLELLDLEPRAGVRVITTANDDDLESVLDDARVGSRLRGVLQFVAGPRVGEAKDLVLGPLDRRRIHVAHRDALLVSVRAELEAETPLVVLSAALAAWAAGRGDLDGARLGADRHVEKELHSRLDQALETLDEGRRASADEVLLALATTDGEPIARTREELARAAGSASDAEAVVTHLARDLLVRVGREEVSMLDRRILTSPRLQQLRLSAMDRLAVRERVQDGAERWERGGRVARDLDDGALFDELRAVAIEPARLSPLEREFIDASRHRHRRRRAFTVAVLAVLVASVVGVVLFQKAQAALRRTAEDNERRAERAFFQTALLARARRSTDPYERLAYLVAAERSGSEDAMLAPEVAETVRDLVPAYFLSQARVDALTFPWDARFLVGIGPSGNLVTIDLYPPHGEPLVFDSNEIDAMALPVSVLPRRPRTQEIALGDAPTVEYTPFSFDTSLVARSARGEVSVVRLSDDGVRVAARFGERCDGRLAVARRAPVFACPTARGVASFDVATGRATLVGRAATFVTVADDGTSVAGATGQTFFVARSDGSETTERTFDGDVALAAFSPAGDAVAVVVGSEQSGHTLHVVPLGGGTLETAVSAAAAGVPASLRWADDGRFVLLCDARGGRSVHPLVVGFDDASASVVPRSCEVAAAASPRRIEERSDFAGLSGAAMGMHLSRGGFALDATRYVTSSLLLVSSDDRRLDGLLSFHADVKAGETLREVVRTPSTVYVEASQTIRARSVSDGRSYDIGRGRLLGACPDGGVLAYRAEEATVIVTELRANAEVARFPRSPALLVGASPDCRWVVRQLLDGTLEAHAVGRGDETRTLGRVSGYVYLARRAAHRYGPDEMVVAASDGSVLRLGPERGAIAVAASAVGGASAIGGDPTTGDVLFVDAVGLTRAPVEGPTDLLLGSSPLGSFHDLVVLPTGDVAYLAASQGLEVFDLRRRELVQRFAWTGVGRFVPWDSGGSFAYFDGDVENAPDVHVLPRGDLLGKVGNVASNLATNEGRLLLR